MTSLLKGLWAGGVLLALAGAPAVAQDSARKLLFSLNREGPPLTQFSIVVLESGRGVYTPRLIAQMSDLPGTEASADGKTLSIPPALVKKLFAAVPMVEGGRCETHNKGIAKTGVKVLQYAGGSRTGSCTYNYSDDDRVNDATTTFEALAETMRYGERLAMKLRFDRLGLDTELEGLQSAVTEGRALEVGNIAPVLKTIAGDERVMDRVRRRADRLLEAAGQGTAQSADTDTSAR